MLYLIYMRNINNTNQRENTMVTIRTSNSKARCHVENAQDFKGANTFGQTGEDSVYRVYSYGYHFPMFVWKAGQWYGNEDKYSVSTSKHFTQLHPNSINMIMLSTQEMKEL